MTDQELDRLLYAHAGAARDLVLAQLPPDSVQLGVLFQEGADSRTGLYAARREHAGCILWAAPGGDLYLQLSGGGYARACPEPG